MPQPTRLTRANGRLTQRGMNISMKITWALLAVAVMGCASAEDRADRAARKLAAAQIVVGKTEPGSACNLDRKSVV